MLLVLGSVIGFFASRKLTIDKNALSDGSQTALSCDINAFVSCSGVMQSPEAEAFGFTNSLMGLVGFVLVCAIGVFVVLRVAVPMVIWAGLQIGLTLGILFVLWLQFESIFGIGKLCPYCMVVWAVTIPLFVYVTAQNLRVFAPTNRVARLVGDWTLLITLLWYVAVAAVIWFQFGSTLWA